MLLEELIEKGKEVPEYDWEGYYGWLYSELGEDSGAQLQFWVCKHCLSLNVLVLPARYAKCRECHVIHIGSHMPSLNRR